jgi:hypothetical protein
MDPGDPAGFTTSRANGFPFNKFRCFLLRERGGQAKNWVAKHVGGRESILRQQVPEVTDALVRRTAMHNSKPKIITTALSGANNHGESNVRWLMGIKRRRREPKRAINAPTAANCFKRANQTLDKTLAQTPLPHRSSIIKRLWKHFTLGWALAAGSERYYGYGCGVVKGHRRARAGGRNKTKRLEFVKFFQPI